MKTLVRLQYNQVVLNTPNTIQPEKYNLGKLVEVTEGIAFIPASNVILTTEQLTAIAELIKSTDTLWGPNNESSAS